MQRKDQDKPSFVDFLRSIRFRPRQASIGNARVETHFANLANPRARPARQPHADDCSLERSGN